MKLSKITKKSNNKYELIIDNKKHVTTDDVLLKYNLLKPRELTKEEYDEIISYASFEDIYIKVLKYITFKMRSEKEVKEKLVSLNASKDISDKIIVRLLKEGYINNKKYMECFIKDNMKLTLYGPHKIASNLCKKGFSLNDIYKYLDNIPYEQWKSRVNKIVEKSLKSAKNGSKRAILGKLRNELISNGYKDEHFSDILGKIDINEEDSLKKEYEKIKKSLEKKYSGEKLEYMIKQKLYSKGYNISNL